MKNIIKNASGKPIGTIELTENTIKIMNDTKPVLEIQNSNLAQQIINKDNSPEILKTLYDNYFLSTGEIAALYEVCYSNMNKQLKSINLETSAKQGRRNRSYGKPQSEECLRKKSETMKRKVANGEYTPPNYERTPEIKEKISHGLKEYYKHHPQDPTPHINNWKKGVYDNVDFHIGIGGKMFSIKNQKTYNFRSLLELYYMLLLEDSTEVEFYEYEPIHINCENGHIYTPDILVNNTTLIELKSYKYIHSKDEILNSFNYKKEQAEKYCKNTEMKYKVVFDIDIDFDSSRYKRELKNHPEIIEKYHIIFNQPERMVIK